MGSCHVSGPVISIHLNTYHSRMSIHPAKFQYIKYILYYSFNTADRTSCSISINVSTSPSTSLDTSWRDSIHASTSFNTSCHENNTSDTSSIHFNTSRLFSIHHSTSPKIWIHPNTTSMYWDVLDVNTSNTSFNTSPAIC